MSGSVVVDVRVAPLCSGILRRAKSGRPKRGIAHFPLFRKHLRVAPFEGAKGRAAGSRRKDPHRAVRKSLEDRRIDIEVLRDQSGRRVSEPIAERDLLVLRALEERQELQLGRPGVLDEVTAVTSNDADVAGAKILSCDARTGVEHDHAPFALDPVLPFVRVRMPMHLP
jgi:hypothetical protein